jgi:hypothetical protein
MIRPIQLTTAIVVCEPFYLFTIDTVDVQSYSFKGLLIACVSKPLVYLLNNVVNVVIKGSLTKR